MATTNLDHHDLVNATDNPGGPLVREEVMDRIFEFDYFERPFVDLCSTVRTGNRYFEWVDDEYGSVNLDNALIDGQAMTGNDATSGDRMGNQCQILGKEVDVSTRADVARSIGRQGSVSYQIRKAQVRCRRDQEAIWLSDQASVVDDGNTTAGRVGGFFSWVKTNTIFGATGADGGFNTTTKLVDAPTAGTAAGITEVNIKDIFEGVYTQGGRTDCIIGRPTMIRKLSEFYMSTNPAGAATQTNQKMGEEANRSNAAYTSVTVIISDFGFIVKLIPNRLQPLSTIAVPVANVSHLAFVDPKGVRCAYLRGYTTEQLAKLGLSRHMMVTMDGTLSVNEKIQGAIRDIDETAAVTAS